MRELKSKNTRKTILKLLVVIPLFLFIGMYIGMLYINGNYYSLLVLPIICIVAGMILAKY